MSNPILQLTSAEALVLVDFLLRFRDEEKLTIACPAEEQVLWDLCAVLESQVPELVHKDYRLLLAKAREAVVKDDNFQ